MHEFRYRERGYHTHRFAIRTISVFACNLTRQVLNFPMVPVGYGSVREMLFEAYIMSGILSFSFIQSKLLLGHIKFLPKTEHLCFAIEFDSCVRRECMGPVFWFSTHFQVTRSLVQGYVHKV